MPSLEESVEEESMEILSHSDFRTYLACDLLIFHLLIGNTF